MTIDKAGKNAMNTQPEALRLADQCVCGEPDTPGTHRIDGPCLAEQPAPVSEPHKQQEPGACTDEMCACRGGPCVSCPDGEREKELADVRDSRDFYKRRTDELQKAQSQMRDPERTMVCDILANGRLLVPAGGRYSTSPPAQPIKPWVGLTDEEILACDPQEECWGLFDAARAIEAKLREKNA